MEPGDRIDGWVVERRLGTGGMGSVYRCRNASTERIFAALKVLDRSLRSNPEASTRFVREAEILAGLDHPNIVRVRNVRVDADPPYLEMEFVEGEPLDVVIARGPLPYAQARRYLLQMASAVEYLHARGVRHRDLKPANVLVDAQDYVRIVDFGLATETNLERITEQGLSFGTVSYAPPEWMEPDRLDPVQWDLYAMGVVFYELLTGQVAFPMSGQGAVKKQLLQVMMHKQVAPPLDPGEGFPEPVRALIRELTARDIVERPQTAQELHARLRALPEQSEETRPISDRRGEPTPRPVSPESLLITVPPRTRSLGWVAAAAGSIAVLLGIAGTAWWVLGDSLVEPVVAPLPVPLAAEFRSVEVQFLGAPAGLALAATLGGESRSAVDGVVRFTEVPLTAQEVVWVAGADCGGCPGTDCSPACGTGTVPVQAGAGAASLVVPVRPGTGTLTVDIPAATRDSGKAKRRKKVAVTARLDGVVGAVDGSTARFGSLAPGRHQLVVDVGDCPSSAAGCWPSGVCPDKCRSEAREVVIPFDGGELRERMELPLP